MPFAAAMSTKADTATAFDEAIRQALDQLPQPELAAIYYSPHYLPNLNDVFATTRKQLASTVIFGGVGEAIAGDDREIENGPAVSVWLASWNGAVACDPFHLAARRTPDGVSLLGWPDSVLEADPKQSTMLLVGDPHTFPITELFLPQLNDDFAGLPVFGGMCSGTQIRGQTALLANDRVVKSGAVGVLLRGPAKVRGVVSQGCRPIGRPMVVTKARENLILELGGRSPLDQLRALWPTLSERDRDLFQNGPHLGAAINEYRDSFGRGDFLVRNLFGFDTGSGALAVTDYVRVGQTVQFHVRDAETADEDLKEMLAAVQATHADPLGAALLFSCNGRGTRLFDEPNHDAATIQRAVGRVPLAGFFAAGELGPVGGRNFIHGFTASVALFEK